MPWAGAITYIRRGEGWLSLSVVIDLFSRRIAGWSMQGHMRTAIVLDALTITAGRPVPGRGVLSHSDRGSQYTSDGYQTAPRGHGITCSMSREGNCRVDAVVESFLGTLNNERLHRRPWPPHMEAMDAIHEHIEVFCNRQRRHSILDDRSPAGYEELDATTLTRAA